MKTVGYTKLYIIYALSLVHQPLWAILNEHIILSIC